MDAIAGLLDGPRAQGAFLLRSIMKPPWALSVQDEAPLTVIAAVTGSAWIVYEGDDPQLLEAGDVAIARGPDHYVVADDLTTTPQIVIHPGQRCATITGESLELSMALGVRTWGSDAEGTTVMLTGTYQAESETSRKLLDILPRLVVMKADASNSGIVSLLGAEIVKDEPGQEAVLDRLLDLLVVAVLRTWFARDDSTTPSWFSAYADPIVGKALRLIQNDLANQWTVVKLANAVGVSRAALARRFNDLVGEPPMTFLTGWRLALAADYLCEPSSTVSGVSRLVGYTSPFTFSAAFKRQYGVSPHNYRSKVNVNEPQAIQGVR